MRKSTFKNVSVFDVYKDSGEGLTCNLSDTSSKKFGIDMDTGSIVNSDNKKDGEEEVDLSDENKLIKVFKYTIKDYKKFIIKKLAFYLIFMLRKLFYTLV